MIGRYVARIYVKEKKREKKKKYKRACSSKVLPRRGNIDQRYTEL